MNGRVLIVAGSDSGGGAGIQADIKTVTALGGYAATAITALTAQDTNGVHAVHPVPPAFVQQQMQVVLDDIGADAIKTGMLGDAATVLAVAEVLASCAGDVPVVIDPVMIAKGGATLAGTEAVRAMMAHLLPLAAVITPNIPEAEAMLARRIMTVDDMQGAAADLLRKGARAVLLKGGHLAGDHIVDLLATPDGIEAMSAPRIESRHTHGTGCTLASAVAIGLAQDMSLRDAVHRARRYVRQAIASAPGYGGGHGPLNHAVSVRRGRTFATRAGRGP